MLATGGDSAQPSSRNPNVHWIFSTSLTEKELNTLQKIRTLPLREKVRLVIVGRQEFGKGTDVLINSLPLIKKDFPQVSLEVIGDGAALSNFKALSVSMGLNAHVKFHGYVSHDEVTRLLHDCDLFCFPTASEGFPKVVLEALACGLPVITTRVSVLPNLIGTGCGMLIDEITPVEIAEAVRQCLSDSERYNAMSAQAVKTANQYSLERWRDTIGAFLHTSWEG